ncbi:MAG: PQQ-binding-like beta-propeller repeat protein [Planctomycetes bacterium]|jgi:outer membrane protein assembly factor BamB|nr:PQQ-binding-like beta-propeller repeat protein [Planctomycetota bacterium]
MRSITMLLAAVVVFSVSACRPAVKPQLPLAQAPKEISAIGWQEYWSMPLALMSGERVTSMHHLDDTLYCITNRGNLIAMDPTIGVVRWRLAIGSRGEMPYRPVHATKVMLSEKVPGVLDIMRNRQATDVYDVVITNTRRKVFVINRNSGQVLREIALEFSANSACATDGTLVFLASADASYRGLSMQTTEQAWAMWSVQSVVAPPVFKNSTLYVGGQDGVLRAVAIQGHGANIVWNRDLGAPITHEFAVSDSGVFVAGGDNRLHAFTPQSERPLWAYPYVTEGVITSGVQLTESSVMVRSAFGGLSAVSIADGQERWRLADGLSVVAAGEGLVYVHGENHTLMVVDEATGEVQNVVKPGQLQLLMGNTTDLAIWGADGKGVVHCLRPVASGTISKQMLETAR